MTDKSEIIVDNDRAPKPLYVLEGKAARFLLLNGVDNASGHYSVIEMAIQHGFVVEPETQDAGTASASDVPVQQEL